MSNEVTPSGSYGVPPVRSGLRRLARMGDLPILVAAAFGLYLLAAYGLVDRLGVLPTSRARMVGMQQFLAAQTAPQQSGAVYFLGSSVTVDGVDCDVIDAELGGKGPSFNLAWLGAGPRQLLLAAPLVRAADPSAVVIGLDLSGLATSTPIPEDLLTIAGWWRFIPDDDRPWLDALLTDGERDVLYRSPVEQLMAFRSFPSEALNAYVREASRKSLRYEGFATNFKAPWVLKAAVSPTVLQRGIEAIHRSLAEVPDEPIDESATILESLITYLRDGGRRRVFVVLTPAHPDLLAQLTGDYLPRFRRRVLAVCDRTGAMFVDHIELLADEHFSDALHPIGEGRELWSRELARVLQSGEGDSE